MKTSVYSSLLAILKDHAWELREVEKDKLSNPGKWSLHGHDDTRVQTRPRVIVSFRGAVRTKAPNSEMLKCSAPKQ